MLNNGYTFSADGRQYKVLEKLGSGANTVAYLAECNHGELVTKCILKEYAPHNNDDFEVGKTRFLDSGKAQNEIRQFSVLNNQTPPVSHVFEANGTAYIDVACYNGTTLDKLDSLTLPQYMELCSTIAKTVGYYHKSSYLCLDLKPENIFILQNTPNDTVTQLVEFIDFDSIRDVSGYSLNTVFSYTREWAAPEQLNPYATGKLGNTADIYTVGEIVFYLLFGRHSSETEHRGFSKYPFEECKHEYRRYTERPDIQALYTRLFRNTIRSSASNRYKTTDEVTKLLGLIVAELNQKDYVIPLLPSVSPDFVGRDTEIRQIVESLQKNNVLYITGIGGIGKTTLVKNYISRYRTEYDIIAYLEYDGDFQHTFCDDMQLQISAVSRQDGEPLDEYFARKIKSFKRICGNRRVLFILDNYTDRLTKDLSRIIDCGYNTIITTRNHPPKNSFPFMEVTAIADTSELFRLVVINLERQLTKEERLCFEAIITLVQGHTLVLELIARQIASGRLDIHTALDLIRENGFSRFSNEKIGNYKDGEEVYDTLHTIISALFSIGSVNEKSRLVLKILSLLSVRGLETSFVQVFFPNITTQALSEVASEGWIYFDKLIRIHPVIAEAVYGWEWSIDDVSVMEYHQKMIDIYVEMENIHQIKVILREAEKYKNQHQRHIIKAMYYDMLGFYYDTLCAGGYKPYNEEEAMLLDELLDCADNAIKEIELSTDVQKEKYQIKYYISLANILLRSHPNCYEEIEEILVKADKMIKTFGREISPERCYYLMSSAWYYTLISPDLEKTKLVINKAFEIAPKVFKTDIELISIVYIPAADCYDNHNERELATDLLYKAIGLCEKHPDVYPYIDKHAELIRCLIDVYYYMGKKHKCRELLKELDDFNDKYREQGIHRDLLPENRKLLEQYD